MSLLKIRKLVDLASFPAIYLIVGFLFFMLFPPSSFEETVSLKLWIVVIETVVVLILIGVSRQIISPIPLLLLILLMFISVLWSQNPIQTANNTFFYLTLFVTALFLAGYQNEIREAISVATGILILISCFVIVILNSSLIDSLWSRTFSAIYSNNNGFAFVLISGLPALISLQPQGALMRATRYLLICLLCLFVFISGSETELGALSAIIVLWALIHFSKSLRLVVVLFVPFISGLFLILLLLFPNLLLLMGKDPTIAGRTTLWEQVIRHIQQGTFVGMGWTYSWPDNSVLFIKLKEMGIPLHHAHNEILNWLLTLGVLGLALVLWIYISMIVGGVKLINAGQKELGTWVTLTAVGFFVRGLSEISETNALGWFIWALAYSAMMYAFYSSRGKRILFSTFPRFSNSASTSVEKN